MSSPDRTNKCMPSNDGNIGGAIYCLSKRVNELVKELDRIESRLEDLIMTESTQCTELTNQERQRASERENAIEEALNQEYNRAIESEQYLQQEIDQLNSDIQQEVQDSIETANLLNNKILKEVQDRENAVTFEYERAVDAETNLNNLISQENSRALETEAILTNSIQEEENRAKSAERILKNDINTLEAIENSDIAHVTDLITTEEARAKAVESSNTNRIQIIEDKIPNAASPDNQLADKRFVNSSISTSTAIYHGSKNLINDLNLSVSASHLDIENALQTVFTDTVDNNDYCFVQIPTSDDDPLQISITERYKFNGTVWLFEYVINTSGFTSLQWDALNSEINNLLVRKLIDLPTYLELVGLLAAKVDKTQTINGHDLTGNITISKSDVGLGNVGDFKAVSTVANQGLDITEQSNARANIGAGTSSLILGTTLGTAYDGKAGDDLEKRITALEEAMGGIKLRKISTQDYTSLQTKGTNTLYIFDD